MYIQILNVTLLKLRVEFAQSFRNLYGKIGDDYAAWLFFFQQIIRKLWDLESFLH